MSIKMHTNRICVYQGISDHALCICKKSEIETQVRYCFPASQYVYQTDIFLSVCMQE
jgi:hypothetical protein